MINKAVPDVKGEGKDTGRRPLGIYIHIPFCVRKCGYCDFLSFPCDEEARTRYLAALQEEIKRSGEELKGRYQVETVFFGGGTPSILSGEALAGLLDTLRGSYDITGNAEITVECNPGTLDPGKLDVYRRAGVNRLSIGLQSADDAELKLLGRIHTCGDFLESFSYARSAGFDNINVDLIFSLPGQTPEKWAGTLEKISALIPEHISAYSLMIEEGTPFYRRYGAGGASEALLPDEDTDRQMYAYTGEFLGRNGYERYEISNYAKPGFECRHNLSYWERVDYKGLGLGASSLIDGVRYKNSTDFRAYLGGAAGYEEVTVLSENDILEERMFLGLRKMSGVQLDDVLEQTYGDIIGRLIHEGLLSMEDGRIRLTDYGIDISNYVFAQFLL